MENSNKQRGFFIAVGITCLLVGVIIGYAMKGNNFYNKNQTAKDFRAEGDYENYYFTNTSRFGASSINSFEDTSYTNRIERIIFYPDDCQDIYKIEKYSRELDFNGFNDFENYCESIGLPIG